MAFSFEKMTDIWPYMFLSDSVEHCYAILKLRCKPAQFHNLHSVDRKCFLSFQKMKFSRLKWVSVLIQQRIRLLSPIFSFPSLAVTGTNLLLIIFHSVLVIAACLLHTPLQASPQYSPSPLWLNHLPPHPFPLLFPFASVLFLEDILAFSELFLHSVLCSLYSLENNNS